MPTIVSMTILMVVVCFFAWQSDKNAITIQTDVGQVYKEKVFVFLIIIALSFYAAMRTHGNDTYAYVNGFIELDYSLADFFSKGLWYTEKGPLFTLFEIFCKTCISNNYHIFFLIVALISNGSLVLFLRKYSPSIVVPLFLYITMSGYECSLTGMRQQLATAIVLWAIPLAAEKKWIRFIIVLWVSFRIHFITILYVTTPFFLYNVWNITSIIFIILIILAGAFFSWFGNRLLDISSILGIGNYDDSILYGNKINIFRILVYCITPIWSFFQRKNLSQNNAVLRCLTNISIISAGFMLLGLFGNANTFGRFGMLFEIGIYVTLPMLIMAIEDRRTRTIIMILCILGFLGYYVYGISIHGLSIDRYQMESVFDWFKQ